MDAKLGDVVAYTMMDGATQRPAIVVDPKYGEEDTALMVFCNSVTGENRQTGHSSNSGHLIFCAAAYGDGAGEWQFLADDEEPEEGNSEDAG